VNIFGGIVRCDIIAGGIVVAVRTTGVAVPSWYGSKVPTQNSAPPARGQRTCNHARGDLARGCDQGCAPRGRR